MNSSGPLLPEHQALLSASGISPEVAAERGYRSATYRDELRALGFELFQCRVPALVLPVHGPDGTVTLYQIRPDAPRLDRRGRTVKYETASGARMGLDVPPRVRHSLDDPTVPLWITEGVRKADAAVSRGLCCVALLGVWNWRGRNQLGGKTVIADWETVALNERTAYLAFDSDAVTKREVGAALRRLKGFLESRGARVRVVHLPPQRDGGKTGLDDFLSQGHSAEDLRALAREDAPPEVPPPSNSREHPDELYSDIGNAHRLVRLHGRDLRFSPARGWLLWDGRRWATDSTQAVADRAQKTLETLWEEARCLPPGESQTAMARWAIRSQQVGRVEAAMRLAESDRALAATPERFDRDPWLLTVRNGTLDLRTGFLRPHDRDDLMTKLAPVVFDSAALAPRWDTFLLRVLPDPAIRSLVQRLAGYALVGTGRDQRLAILYGTGANGKSVLVRLLLLLLGDYGVKARTETFLSRRERSASNDLARLAGARLVVASEPPAGARLDEAMVKEMTGGEPVPARFMYREFFEFVPAFTPLLVTNHKPRIHGTDHGIWRRILLVPFAVRLPEAEQDPALPDKLAEELPGILNWALAGCRAWKDRGLDPPGGVLEATAEYREQEDVLEPFLAERCDLGPLLRVSRKDLGTAYLTWCQENQESPLSTKAFADHLAEKGFQPGKSGSTRLWKGLDLRRGTSGTPCDEIRGTSLGRNESVEVAQRGSSCVPRVPTPGPAVSGATCPACTRPGRGLLHFGCVPLEEPSSASEGGGHRA